MARRSRRASRPGRRVRDAEFRGYGRRKRIMMLALLLVAAQVGAPAPALIQDPRLDRLDPDTRVQVSTVLDSARRVGLPTEPLIQRALEGATKAAPGSRIVAAVRRLSADLSARRGLLTVALSVLADLVASGVPADSAAVAVLALAPQARDADLVEFRRAVERDIALGAPPGAATSVRVNAGANVQSAGSNPGAQPRPRRP